MSKVTKSGNSSAKVEGNGDSTIVNRVQGAIDAQLAAAPKVHANSTACLQALALCGRSGKSRPKTTYKAPKEQEGLVAVPTISVRVSPEQMFRSEGIAEACAVHGKKTVGSLLLREADVSTVGGWTHAETGVVGTDMADALRLLHVQGVIPQ